MLLGGHFYIAANMRGVSEDDIDIEGTEYASKLGNLAVFLAALIHPKD